MAMDKKYTFEEQFAQDWHDLQLIFWEARRKVTASQSLGKPQGYEICRDSHSCWVKFKPYEPIYKGESNEQT